MDVNNNGDGGQTSLTESTSTMPQPDEAAESKVSPYDDWHGKPLTRPECIKVNDILAACADPVDWDALTSLATSTGGFLDDEVRQVACRWTRYVSMTAFDPISGPRLLGYRAQSLTLPDRDGAWHRLPPHKDEGQVELDVNRSFVYYPKSTPILKCRKESHLTLGR